MDLGPGSNAKTKATLSLPSWRLYSAAGGEESLIVSRVGLRSQSRVDVHFH